MNKTLRITDIIIIVLFIIPNWEKFMDTAYIGNLVIATDIIYALAVFRWKRQGF